jgi:hypothetical protein
MIEDNNRGGRRMAVCEHCGGEMKDGISCKDDPIIVDGTPYEPVRWGAVERPYKRRPLPENCTDCATPIGGVHHPGCCAERCPVCLGQAFGCWHFAEPDPDEDDGDYELNYLAEIEALREADAQAEAEADPDRDVVRSSARRCQSHLFRQASRG